MYLRLTDGRHLIRENSWIRLLRCLVGDSRLMLYWHLLKGKYVVGVWIDKASRLIAEEAVLGASLDSQDERLVDYLRWIRSDGCLAQSKERQTDSVHEDRRQTNDLDDWSRDHLEYVSYLRNNSKRESEKNSALWSRV